MAPKKHLQSKKKLVDLTREEVPNHPNLLQEGGPSPSRNTAIVETPVSRTGGTHLFNPVETPLGSVRKSYK